MAIFSANGFDPQISVRNFDIDLGGVYEDLLESYEYDLDVIKAIHAYDIAEIKAMESSYGGYQVLLESEKKNIFKTIKEKLIKIWNAIKGFFARIFNYMANIVQSDKAFIVKHKEKLMSLKFVNFEVEMFSYSNLKDYVVKYEATKSGVLNISGKGIGADFPKEYDITEELDKIRGTACGKTEGVSASDFTKTLKEYLRGGADKEKIKITSMETYVTAISGNQDLLKSIKKMKSSVDEVFTASIKEADEKLKEAEDTKEGKKDLDRDNNSEDHLIRFFKQKSDVIQKSSSIFTTACNVFTSTVKERNSVYRSICLKAMGHKDEKETK